MTAVVEPEAAGEVGAARRRKEDARLITGRTRWTDNIALPGMLHLAILRSPHASARVVSVDVRPALRQPGVIDAFSGADVADVQGSLPCAWPVTEDIVHPVRPPLADGYVRHHGEAVAVVVARDRDSAVDALEAIEVEYEPLPPVLDLAAAARDEGLVHPDKGTNRSYTWVFDSAQAGTGTDVAAEAASAEVTLRRRYVQQRLIPAFMEPRSVVVDPGMGEYTIWSATQIPHILRVFYALLTGVPEHKIRVIAPDVGGGFGGKLQVTPEEMIAFFAARRVQKPVKYTETRGDTMLSAHHGRDQIQDITLTATRDGTLTGIDVKLIANMGAYLGLVGPGVPILGAFMFNSIYKVPAYRFECTGVFTNTTITDAYRGAGRPEATYAIERAMDDLADELGIDPVELRRKNWIKAEEFPFTTVAGLVYDSGDYDAATDKALDLFDYAGLREEQRRRRDSGDPVQLGIGVSTYTEMCGLAPSRILGALRYAAGGWETASVRVLPTGKVEVVTGTSPHGQGHVTAWSQIVADELGVAFEDVEVLHGDTRTSHKGLDTYGSRSLAVGGVALVEACRKVRDKARVVAAHMLECSPDDLEFTGGAFRVRGTPDASKTVADTAFAVFAAHDLPDGVEATLDADATFDPQTFSFPHGTHLCATLVDTQTGHVSIHRYVAVDDVGKVVNPLIVEGQVHGGVAQGIAQALHEQAVYDDSGTLLTGSFVEYTIPSAADLPQFVTDRTETPATSNPLGVKGVGEAGAIASTPAVVNAVVDALRPFGVDDIPMPCTPEQVWRAIKRGGAS
ncbi:xanthine dehydrogenase family protein molybdopterin-binding subunit [Dactylosporangium aurantiacum]|uniref:Xanthine dehydrogenase family protein molybdopterin-binding subunit n=2 Tax=Dactylosporangium aurantiacum TaxID=35754 RepID=A0A9Q9MPB9_9ACTN|nr:xanthine dehydrogenase family protein molybdopterin-binding subunit [Dactylosporangium aurantiacum]MDG6109013.1 xanthine dehydrogenase family protein molybdopterin-binding subunit [Dactylosporangium aurantiacum]UWZ56487.1 xanthine dehydrogenase family protein molybdopterin-binding subunit [Dactylosporangium aurantiacum]